MPPFVRDNRPDRRRSPELPGERAGNAGGGGVRGGRGGGGRRIRDRGGRSAPPGRRPPRRPAAGHRRFRGRAPSDLERRRPCVVLVSSRDGSDFGPLVAGSGACGFVPKNELSGAAISASAMSPEGRSVPSRSRSMSHTGGSGSAGRSSRSRCRGGDHGRLGSRHAPGPDRRRLSGADAVVRDQRAGRVDDAARQRNGPADHARRLPLDAVRLLGERQPRSLRPRADRRQPVPRRLRPPPAGVPRRCARRVVSSGA